MGVWFSARMTFLMVAIPAALAGCLEDELPVDVDNLVDATGAVPQTFAMTADDCFEAGFIAIYPMPAQSYLGGVWAQDDVREEVGGTPTHDGVGSPSPLLVPQNGNTHYGFRCESATVNGITQSPYTFGWVGQQVLAPEWDPGGADRHILISGVSFGNGGIADALRATTKADITHTERVDIQWELPKELPRSYSYVMYHDLNKGTYESWSTMAFYRDVEERTVRFWWLVPADGSQAVIWNDHHADPSALEGIKWNPVYWDMQTKGGAQYVTPPGDGVEVGAHNFAIGPGADHTPPYQPMIQNYYEHTSLSWTSGKVFTDVVLEEIWAH